MDSESTESAFELESLEIGAHPLISPVLEQLQIHEHLVKALPRTDGRTKLCVAESAMVMLRNIIVSREPLYGVSEWASRFVPEHLGLTSEQVQLLNDDRLGRMLDKLYAVDRRTLATDIVVTMVREFGLDLSRVHTDSTSLTLSGDYAQHGEPGKASRPAHITYGYNKDHRPDLKQLVWNLTVCGDGAVPVFYQVLDGNTEDSTTHIDTWDVLSRLANVEQFLYVADSKLCTRANMGHIASRGGQFLTVLPRSRKESSVFRKRLVNAPVEWIRIWTRPNPRKRDGPDEVFEAYDELEPSAEGYRIVWFRSSVKWALDEHSRTDAIDRARYELNRYVEKLRRHHRTKKQIQTAVDAILKETGTGQWLNVSIRTRSRAHYKQQTPGRPGRDTLYSREELHYHELDVQVNAEGVQASASSDGLFPLITNVAREHATPLALLQAYKYQAFVEKRHEQLKTVAEVTPVYYKSPQRIEAALFLYFIALCVHALIERQIRQAMAHAGVPSIPLYPEARACAAPTAHKLLSVFGSLRRHRLFDNDTAVKTFWDPLCELHRQILDLLNIDPDQYGTH